MSSHSEIRASLLRVLTPEGHELLGCHRRNRWHGERGDPPAWRFVEGNAVLDAIADRYEIPVASGLMTSWLISSRFLCRWHGGEWGYWVVNDALDHWALIQEKHTHISHRIYVLHEYKGNLDVKAVDVPDDFDPVSRREEIFTSLYSEEPGRIPKSGARAIRTCKWCHFKQRCDALDKLHGDTGDWSPNYPIP